MQLFSSAGKSQRSPAAATATKNIYGWRGKALEKPSMDDDVKAHAGAGGGARASKSRHQGLNSQQLAQLWLTHCNTELMLFFCLPFICNLFLGQKKTFKKLPNQDCRTKKIKVSKVKKKSDRLQLTKNRQTRPQFSTALVRRTRTDLIVLRQNSHKEPSTLKPEISARQMFKPNEPPNSGSPWLCLCTSQLIIRV